MEPVLKYENQVKYLECLPETLRIANEKDALELVGLCAYYETDKVLISDECLDPAFLDLKSGLAGAVLLKFSIYKIRAAVIIPSESIGHGKFADFVLETNRGNQFRVFSNRDDAIKWLVLLGLD